MGRLQDSSFFQAVKLENARERVLAVAVFASVALTGFGEVQAICTVGAESERGGHSGFRRLWLWPASRPIWWLPPAL
jgi:hypothetical protein